jgi:hypothetical protein
MKVSTLLIGLTIAALSVAPAAAQQQSLGDVAGSIKLKRPEGESVVIDQNSVGKTRRVPSGVTNENFFLATLGDCLTETRAMHALLVEARGGEAFYREEWRGRVAELGLRLEGARADLRMARAEGRMQEALELANYGADTAGDAYQILADAVAQNRPVFSEARKLSEEAIKAFEDAKKTMGTVARANAAEEYALPINPLEANEVMTALCRGSFADGSSGFNQCIAEQRAAVDAMGVRSGPGVGLNASTFNVIRNNCRFEWPNNYVSMDRCERSRAAAEKRN